jgi:hypothetical protein
MPVDVERFERGPFRALLRFWPARGIEYSGLEDALALAARGLSTVGVDANGRVDHLTEQLVFEYSLAPGSAAESLGALARVVSVLESAGLRYSDSEHERIHAGLAASLPDT